METTHGDIVFDLFTDKYPIISYNFLKLCKIKYYNNHVLRMFGGGLISEITTPNKIDKHGVSVFGMIFGEKNRFFSDSKRIELMERAMKEASLVLKCSHTNGSWFALSQIEIDSDPNEEKLFLVGKVSEGFSVLESIHEPDKKRGKQITELVQIKHSFILTDPFTDLLPKYTLYPSSSPDFIHSSTQKIIIPSKSFNREETEEHVRVEEAENHSLFLEMIGDIPALNTKPPRNVLFVCKLNPITNESDLGLIFSQYGDISDCDIIRDWKTGESLSYGFVGFYSVAACERAYFKLNNAIIDDRRIKVDFTQSVAKNWTINKRNKSD